MKKITSMVLVAAICATSFSSFAYAKDWSDSDSKDKVYVTEDSAKSYFNDTEDYSAEKVDHYRGQATLRAGQSKDFETRIVYGNEEEEWKLHGTILWTSDKPEIADVDENGIVTAYSSGTARITATAWDNQSRKHVQTTMVEVIGNLAEGQTVTGTPTETAQQPAPAESVAQTTELTTEE